MLSRLLRVSGELDAAGLAAAAGVHLGLDHDRPVEAHRDRPHFVGSRGDIAVGHRDSRRAEQCPGLVFVEVQAGLVERERALNRSSGANSSRTPKRLQPLDLGIHMLPRRIQQIEQIRERAAQSLKVPAPECGVRPEDQETGLLQRRFRPGPDGGRRNLTPQIQPCLLHRPSCTDPAPRCNAHEGDVDENQVRPSRGSDRPRGLVGANPSSAST